MTPSNPANDSASNPPDDPAGPSGPREPQPPNSGTLLRLFGAMLATRLALLRVDFASAAGRVRTALWLGVVCFISAAMTLVFLSAAVLIVFWDSHRIEAAIGLPVLFAVVCLVAGLLSRQQIRAAPHAFEASAQALRADREALVQATRPIPPG